MNEAEKGLKRTPFDPADLERGEDGELYHLPTLRALHAAGRLPRGSAGDLLLMRQGALQLQRLIA